MLSIVNEFKDVRCLYDIDSYGFLCYDESMVLFGFVSISFGVCIAPL